MLSKSGIIFTTMVFYAALLFLMSFNVQGIESNAVTEDYGVTEGISIGNVILNITSLGWLNIILFTPLVVIFGWVIVTSLIPTVNSGS